MSLKYVVAGLSVMAKSDVSARNSLHITPSEHPSPSFEILFYKDRELSVSLVGKPDLCSGLELKVFGKDENSTCSKYISPTP